MSSILIKNADIVMKNEILENHSVYCADGKIKKIIAETEHLDIQAEHIYDAKGYYLAPGYIDLHIHGLMNNRAEQGIDKVQAIAKELPRYGVTGFLPSITPKPNQKEDVLLLDELSQARPEGSLILGFFLEGHFLHLTGAIANIPEKQTKAYVEALKKAAHPYKVIFGVSPELEGAEELITYMTEGNVPAFITHTSADAQQTKRAIKVGASHATHFYDVFPYIGDKEGGVRGCGTVEAIMASPQVSVDFILDGEHVEPVAVEMALACKGSEKVCLITDANVNAGLPPGRYKGIDGIEVEMLYEGGPARRIDAFGKAGGLTGSGLTMDRAVKNAVGMLGLDIPQAVAMASINPARVLNLNNRKGLVEKGYDADLILLDKDLNVLKCWINGKVCFENK